jgi:quercetin dioxygenase-like cupin family protein
VSFDDRVILIGRVERDFDRLPDLEAGPVRVELVRYEEEAKMIQVHGKGTRPKAQGDLAYFTGQVEVETLVEAPSLARVRVAQVTFELGTRTAWHTHPLGQTLIVPEGVGWVQQEGGPKREIRAGDVVWIPQGVKHWHGATATTSMTHIAIQEALDGKTVDWMEKVTDEEYNRR